MAMQDQARYYSLGMTYMSDNQSIIPRYLAGNILFEESALVKPLLIIEPVAEQITTISTLRVLDTAFQYYKFPVSVNITGSVDVDFEIQALEIEEPDLISTRYTIPPIFDTQNQPQTYLRINTNGPSTWFKYNDGNGALDFGYRRLPFVGPEQQELGTYTITQNTLDTLRAKNQTLKFTIKTQFTSQNKTGNVGFWLSIGLATPETWRSSGFLYELYSDTKGMFGTNEYPVLELEYVLDITKEAAYDNYEINVKSSDSSWVLTDNCYWRIDVIDIPTTPSLTGTIGHGVYSFGGDSRLSETQLYGTTYPIFDQFDGQIEALGIYPDASGNVVQSESTDDTSNTSGIDPFMDNYPPFGVRGYNAETREFVDNNGDSITYMWSSYWNRWSIYIT